MGVTVKRKGPSLDRVEALLSYNRKTGVLTWKVSRGSVKAGKIAGCPNADGYLMVGIDGIVYYAHQIVWLILYKIWPTHEIDHKNGNKANNKPKNIRRATFSQNITNKGLSKVNKTGYKGITFVAGKWNVQIMHKRKSYYLGRFSNKKEAALAYNKAAREIWGEFAFVNKVQIKLPRSIFAYWRTL